jgi:hypothetical protein
MPNMMRYSSIVNNPHSKNNMMGMADNSGSDLD